MIVSRMHRPSVPIIEYLNEADIKHGKRVFINFSQLPKSVKDDIYQDLERNSLMPLLLVVTTARWPKQRWDRVRCLRAFRII